MKTRIALAAILLIVVAAAAEDFPEPYRPPCTERENVFEFTAKPAVKLVSKDNYEITFAVKGYCDVEVGLIDENGFVVRHLGAAVLGANAPAPFQKNSLQQKIYWNGKDDLDQYVREPEKLKVRVRLGLRPQFDKRLGGVSAKNLPGYVWGIEAAPDGVYVCIKGAGSGGHLAVRKFDRDANYVMSLVPPPANLPESKLGGMAYIEYEKGKKALHAVNVIQSVSRDGMVFPDIGGKHGPGNCQVAIVGNRIYYANAGQAVRKGNPSILHYIHTDGSTDPVGIKGVEFLPGRGHAFPRFAASPDGSVLYMVGTGGKKQITESAVWVRKREGKEPGKVFFGDPGKPGAGDDKLNSPTGIDTDAQGRVYVLDQMNNRIQVLSPDGKFLKTIKMTRPMLVRVHKKTGAVYVLHMARVRGKSVQRITKLKSFDDPAEAFHHDEIEGSMFAVDSWSAKPRIWIGGGKVDIGTVGVGADMTTVRVYEEDGGRLVLLDDFDEAAEIEAGNGYRGRWSGNRGHGHPRANCDPIREHFYLDRKHIFDMKTGRYLGTFKTGAYAYEDIDFDKRGYMHGHANPGFDYKGVWRVDPSQKKLVEDRGTKEKVWFFPEVPYDYGLESKGKFSSKWIGILPVKDQQGAKYFQDGMGVNMQGDVAEESNIYYVPKMEEAGYSFMQQGLAERKAAGEYGGGKAGAFSYEKYIEQIRTAEKQGEAVYSIARQPGISLSGGTIWVFDRTGELRHECAVSAGKFINGAQLDEDGAVYFVNSRSRMIGDRHFLAGQGGTFGMPDDKTNRNPFTATLIKTVPGKKCTVLLKSSPIKLDPPPDRPPDLMDISFPDVFGPDRHAWVEGAEWLYAGASPMVSNGCSCPTMRHNTDWYKRTFVPEMYRHSIGILDTAGNLIAHVGTYGNFDSCSGPKSRIPVGDDGIGIFQARSVDVTDNYMAFEDWGERIQVLKLTYRAEETATVE